MRCRTFISCGDYRPQWFEESYAGPSTKAVGYFWNEGNGHQHPIIIIILCLRAKLQHQICCTSWDMASEVFTFNLVFVAILTLTLDLENRKDISLPPYPTNKQSFNCRSVVVSEIPVDERNHSLLCTFSALEVFLKRYALYKFTFYLLTYLLTKYA